MGFFLFLLFLFMSRRVCAPRRDTTRNRFGRASLRGALRSFLAPVRVASRLWCSVLELHPAQVLLSLVLLVGDEIRPGREAHQHRIPGARPLPPTLTAAGAHLFGEHKRNFNATATSA